MTEQTEELMSDREVKPARASVRDVTVRAAERISSGFVRITVGNDSADFGSEFKYLGYDQWMRLFLPNQAGTSVPPYGDIDGWYTRFQAGDPDRRTTIRNYTIRDARRSGEGWEIDIDFVVHAGRSGAVEGVAANWACHAAPGDRLAILDQGRIFTGAEKGRPIVVIADESGLPGVEAVARSLAGRPATYLLEVPHRDDVRDLPGAEATWAIREPGTMPGSAILDAVHALEVDPESFGYVVGEAAFMVRARNRLRSAGVPKSRLDFCAYWRPVDD